MDTISELPPYLRKGPSCPSDSFLKALLRRQYAIYRFRLAGLEPEREGRINMYAWSDEGSFKERSAGIMSMLNVLNALMLVIMFQGPHTLFRSFLLTTFLQSFFRRPIYR